MDSNNLAGMFHRKYATERWWNFPPHVITVLHYVVELESETPDCFTVISEHICFLLLVFSVFTLFSCRFRAVD